MNTTTMITTTMDTKHLNILLLLMHSYLGTISNILKKIPDLACAYLHGSALTNRFRPTSDVDLALLFFPDHPMTDFTETIFEFSSSIESITGHVAHFSLLSSRNLQ